MMRTGSSVLLIVSMLAAMFAPPAAGQVPPAPVAPPPAPVQVTPPPSPPAAAPVAPPPAPLQVPAPPVPPTAVEVPAEPSPYAEPPRVAPGPVPYPSFVEVTPFHRAGATALNIIYVPGKAITCGAGIGVATLMMLATFGSQYPWAVRFVEEGCGYPWYLRPEHVAGQDPKDDR